MKNLLHFLASVHSFTFDFFYAFFLSLLPILFPIYFCLETLLPHLNFIVCDLHFCTLCLFWLVSLAPCGFLLGVVVGARLWILNGVQTQIAGELLGAHLRVFKKPSQVGKIRSWWHSEGSDLYTQGWRWCRRRSNTHLQDTFVQLNSWLDALLSFSV